MLRKKGFIKVALLLLTALASPIASFTAYAQVLPPTGTNTSIDGGALAVLFFGIAMARQKIDG